MKARLRTARVWIAGGLVAAPSVLACSVQNFDYLTRDYGKSADAGGHDDSSLPDASNSNNDDATASDTGVRPDVSTEIDGNTSHPDAAAADGSPPDATTPDASDGGPINFIVNPNFASSTLTGWTVTPASSFVFTQPPQGTATTPQGQGYELATYSQNDPFVADVSQTLTNVPDGLYTFAAWFNRGVNNNVYLYAKNCGGPDTATDGAVDAGAGLTATVPQTSASGWEQVSITGITVVGGTCQVGLVVDAAATDWLNADGFSFEADVSTTGDAGVTDAGSD